MLKHARVGAILVALTLPVGLSACGGKEEVAAAPTPRAVRVARVEVRPLSAALTASGLLVAREEAAVTSELTGYRVAAVNVDQGAWVRQGQVLVRLDDALLRSQVETQRIAAERAEKEAERVRGLDGKGVLSQEDIDARRFQARSARASLNDLLVRQSRMSVRSPVSGVVLERQVRPGDLSGAGATGPMFRIARGGLVEVDAEVPESELGRIRPGMPATVTLPDGASLTGTVRLVSPEVDQQTKLGRARISLPVRPDLRPGGYARAVFSNLARSAPVAPDRAVIFDAEGPYVMVVDASNKVRRVPVRTGARAGGYVELLQGPPAGSRVLTSGATFVLEGDTVKPVAETAPAQAPAAKAAS
jgi:HlyD family secretion protein